MDDIILRWGHILGLNWDIWLIKVWRKGEIAGEDAVSFQGFYLGENGLSVCKMMLILGTVNKYQR